MTAALFFGVWLNAKVDAATREIGKLRQSLEQTFGSTTGEAPTGTPGIDPNAGDYTDAELQDYKANRGSSASATPVTCSAHEQLAQTPRPRRSGRLAVRCQKT
jgi:hypothetical protein